MSVTDFSKHISEIQILAAAPQYQDPDAPVSKSPDFTADKKKKNKLKNPESLNDLTLTLCWCSLL
jgi:hypothetical protein